MNHLGPIIQRVRRGRQRSTQSAVGPRHLTTGLALAAALTLLPSSAGAARVVVTNGPYTPIRLGPSRAHARLTELQAGIPLWAEDKIGGWFRLRLTDDLQGWAHEVSVTPLPRGYRPPPGRLRGARRPQSETGVRIAFAWAACCLPRATGGMASASPLTYWGPLGDCAGPVWRSPLGGSAPPVAARGAVGRASVMPAARVPLGFV